MKKTINIYEFQHVFETSSYQNNFTTEGLVRLFDYLEEFEHDTGEELELDITSLCCDFSEYTKTELLDTYGHLVEGCEETGDDMLKLLKELCIDSGELVYWEETEDCFIIRDF